MKLGKAAGFALLEKVFGKAAVDAGKEAADEFIKLFEQQIDEYDSETKDLEQFKRDLIDYVNWIKKDKPLVFFIDELDRCNPCYAVKVLERIKHLFDISGIVFVLAIDKEQLSHSIRGFYGSDKIAAEDYLSRFIDVEYDMPAPFDYGSFISKLYEHYNYDDLLTKLQHPLFDALEEKRILLYLSECIFENNNLPPRKIDHVFSLARIGLMYYEDQDLVFPSVVWYLAYLKICHENTYKAISSSAISDDELFSIVSSIKPTKELDELYNDGLFFTLDGSQQTSLSIINKFKARLYICYRLDMLSDYAYFDGFVKKYPKEPIINAQMIIKNYKNKIDPSTRDVLSEVRNFFINNNTKSINIEKITPISAIVNRLDLNYNYPILR